MTRVYLEYMPMKRESKAFTDSLYAVLTGAGMFNGSKTWLSGLSGLAFKFSVHKKLLPMSVSAYGQFGTEHHRAIDNLAIFTQSDGGRTRHETFRRYQLDAVQGVKETLDRGIGVIYWIPEFGVIRGYDDEDGIFYVQDGWNAEDQIVLYDNFGLNFTPFWSVHWIGDKVEVPVETMVLGSLRLALEDWDTPFKTLPDREIASGKLAYTYLLDGLKSGDFDEGGARYIIDTFWYARREIRDYLAAAMELFPELKKAYAKYAELTELAPAENGSRSFAVEAEYLAAAEPLEHAAMEQIRKICAGNDTPEQHILPRWGAHAPR
ncbi:hypothetical protein [Paenibacillus sp. NPDC058174]|uniref:hypothetical protein n=1 Tax=Paenibacillus sp. NPDC058174 TaxID=3346366 RepID=UPI0036DEB660